MKGFETKEEVEIAKRAWMNGFAAGVREAEKRILNEFFDRYGAEEHAKFALSVDAYQNEEEDK